MKQLQSSKADTTEQINTLREKAVDYKKFLDVKKAMASSPSDGIDEVTALMREVHEGKVIKTELTVEFTSSQLFSRL